MRRLQVLCWRLRVVRYVQLLFVQVHHLVPDFFFSEFKFGDVASYYYWTNNYTIFITNGTETVAPTQDSPVSYDGVNIRHSYCFTPERSWNCPHIKWRKFPIGQETSRKSGYSASVLAHSALFLNLWNVAKASLNSMKLPEVSEIKTASVMLANAASKDALLSRSSSSACFRSVMSIRVVRCRFLL